MWSWVWGQMLAYDPVGFAATGWGKVYKVKVHADALRSSRLATAALS